MSLSGALVYILRSYAVQGIAGVFWWASPTETHPSSDQTRKS